MTMGFEENMKKLEKIVDELHGDKVSLEKVANSERRFPAAWLASDRCDVTDEFVQYARPLIGEAWPAVPLENGLQRFARFQRIFAERRCELYVPQAYRK